MDLAFKVRKRREELGWSQDDLAKRMGYSSRSSINKIENGRPCSQKIISRLALALDVSEAYLLGWLDEKPREPEEQAPSDIAKELSIILDHLRDTEQKMTVDGNPLDPETKALLIASLENSLHMAKAMNSRNRGGES